MVNNQHLKETKSAKKTAENGPFEFSTTNTNIKHKFWRADLQVRLLLPKSPFCELFKLPNPIYLLLSLNQNSYLVNYSQNGLIHWLNID